MAPDDICELFAAFGPVTVRRMFGGAGIYAGDTMFGLVSDGVIYLKADDQNASAFERENLAPFSFMKKDGKHMITSYRRMPERLYDDPDELVAWARDALAAARRKGMRKSPSSGVPRTKRKSRSG